MKEILNEKLFQDMADRLNNVKGEPRASVLISHLYFEYFLTKILELNIPKPQEIIDDKTGFAKKLKLVKALDMMDEKLLNDLQKINEIRNQFVHSIDIESKVFQEEILKKMKQMYAYSQISDHPPSSWAGQFWLISIYLLHVLKNGMTKSSSSKSCPDQKHE